MDEAENTKQPSPELDLVAAQMEESEANVVEWGLNIVVFLFAILILIIILTSQGVGTNIVAPLAVLGLAAAWLLGRRRGRRLLQRSYPEQLSSLQHKSREKTTALLTQLTSRELEVLGYVAQGYANKRIAFELGIKENTVRNFVSRIMSKLNAKDRTEAVVIAIKHGLIRVE